MKRIDEIEDRWKRGFGCSGADLLYLLGVARAAVELRDKADGCYDCGGNDDGGKGDAMDAFDRALNGDVLAPQGGRS